MRKDPLPEDGQPIVPRASRFAAVGDFASSVARKTKELAMGAQVPDYALHYFDAMCAKFNTLPAPSSTDPAAQKTYADAREIVNVRREEVTWKKLLQLDVALTRNLSFDELLLRIADLRARLDGVAPPLPEGLAVKLDTALAKDMPRLLAEAEALVTRVWLTRMARDARDAYVGELRQTLMYWLLGISVVFMIVALRGDYPYAPMFVVIIVAGMLGALISIVRRLQAVLANAPIPDQSADLSALAHEKRAAALSMFAGAVFAIMLYAVFAAGFGSVIGELAPRFNTLAEDKAAALKTGMDFTTFVKDIGPLDAASYAKVVVWSFIAGFFEQFVPDVLDRIAKKQ